MNDSTIDWSERLMNTKNKSSTNAVLNASVEIYQFKNACNNKQDFFDGIKKYADIGSDTGDRMAIIGKHYEKLKIHADILPPIPAVLKFAAKLTPEALMRELPVIAKLKSRSVKIWFKQIEKHDLITNKPIVPTVVPTVEPNAKKNKFTVKPSKPNKKANTKISNDELHAYVQRTLGQPLAQLDEQAQRFFSNTGKQFIAMIKKSNKPLQLDLTKLITGFIEAFELGTQNEAVKNYPNSRFAQDTDRIITREKALNNTQKELDKRDTIITKREEALNKMISDKKGVHIMNKVLHPDTGKNASDQDRNYAMQFFNAMQGK